MELFIRVPPLVKYIILARLGIVAHVVVERNSLPATTGKVQYDCVIVTPLHLLHIKAIANGLRRSRRRRRVEYAARSPHSCGRRVVVQLRSRGGWTSEILLASLHVLCTDWVGLLPPEWASRMRTSDLKHFISSFGATLLHIEKPIIVNTLHLFKMLVIDTSTLTVTWTPSHFELSLDSSKVTLKNIRREDQTPMSQISQKMKLRAIRRRKWREDENGLSNSIVVYTSFIIFVPF